MIFPSVLKLKQAPVRTGVLFLLERAQNHLSWQQQGYIHRMSKTATIRTRIEPGLKSEVEDILAHLGLTASETVHLLYRQIKLQRGLPFDVRIPNALTTRTLNASKTGKNVKRFGSKKELLADLGL